MEGKMPAKTFIPVDHADTEPAGQSSQASENEKYRKFIQLDYIEGNVRLLTILALDLETLYNLAVNPISPDIRDLDLYGALTDLGAVKSDYKNIPADQDYDVQSGQLIQIDHYQDGLQQTPSNGDPARMQFDQYTGAIYNAEDYDKDRFIRTYTKEELIRLNRSKGIIPELPPGLKSLTL